MPSYIRKLGDCNQALTGKVGKGVPVLNAAPHHETYGGVEIHLHVFLISVLHGGGECSEHFTLRKQPLVTIVTEAGWPI